MRIVRTRRGGRLLHGRHVVSEVLSAPGPTHSVFDVLAAAVTTCARGPKLAMLGFAAGGMLAPMRALGFTHPIEAVDLSLDAMPLFDACRGDWAGQVQVHQGDAAKWLRARRKKWDVVVEDLSMQVPGDVTKPPVSLEVLPALIASRLSKRGIAVVNVLPVKGLSKAALVATLARSYRQARVVHLTSFENRILIGADELPPRREVAAGLRAALGSIGSRLAREIRVRALPIEG